MNVKQSWDIYTNWLELHFPQLKNSLNDGATAYQIDGFEQKINRTLPKEFKSLYMMNNGRENLGFIGAFLGLRFYSLNELQVKMNNNNSLANKIEGLSYPQNHIKTQRWNQFWIPLFGDGSGNFIGMDLDPDISGSYGQIINFGRDYENKYVLAHSLSELLAIVVEKIESGILDESIVEEEPGEFSFGLKPQSHAIDDLIAELY